MVSVSKLEKDYSFLFFEADVPPLEKLLELHEGSNPRYLTSIQEKSKLSISEKKYLSWVRHSLAFLTRTVGVEAILKSWSLDVHSFLEEKWNLNFSDKDEISLAYMGKLGSGELNLSSDIDLIFFGSSGVKYNKIRNFINEVSAKDSIPNGFIIDLDLRPGGKNAPLLCSLDGLGNHLWNSSDPWERYSYTRMRAVLGKDEFIMRLGEIRDKFCYRKYMSSNFFHTFLRLRKQYQIKNKKNERHLKLGPGGIRDIEIFAQTFQILNGGRDVEYRNKSTFALLRTLKNEKTNQKIFEDLNSCYLVLRQAEGEFHALNEQGGFVWKNKGHDFDKIVFESMSLANQLIEDYQKSTENIFGKKERSVSSDAFHKKIEEALFGNTVQREKALSNYEDYFSKKNKVFKNYLTPISSQKDVFASFLDLLIYSDYGCQVLSRRPSLLDLFLIRRSPNTFETENELLESLSDVKMVQRVLASNSFAKNGDVLALGKSVSSSYEYILKKILSKEKGLDLLFMGKMASKEMGLTSDLDFIIIMNDDIDVDIMNQSKEARSIYKKLSHLTVFGPLVPFDTQGGPTGKATPIVVKISSLENFLREEAEPWQKLMYLRHRKLFGSKKLSYLKAPMKEGDIEKLFEVLRKRLVSENSASDILKLGRGGLFHTEFILGALFLRYGVQPTSESSVESLCNQLESLVKDPEKLVGVCSNYYKIAGMRELNFIQKQPPKTEVFSCLSDNFKLLESLSQINLYSKKVEL